MGQVLTSNNAWGLLSVAVATTDTSVSLQSGQGAKFPIIAVGSGNWFYICLINSSGSVEYCQVTATTGDTFTVTRGVDGSTPLAFAASCRCELRWNAAAVNDLQTSIAAVQTNLSNAVAALLSELNAAMGNVITLWSGSIASIPSGWSLCNGSNGTPDLRDKFVVGAGNTYGATTATLAITNLPAHSHPVSDPGHVHGLNQSPHSHGISDPGHAHSISDPGHSHGSTGAGFVVAGAANNVNNSYSGPNNAQIVGSTAAAATSIGIYAAATNVSVQAAYPNISVQAAATGITTTNTGSGTAFSILPPYYALAYIMRTGTWD
jgi:hypothetical protein